MKKKEKKTKDLISNKVNTREPLDCNGNPIDSNREYIGKRIKVPMLSPNASIYNNSATIIMFGSRKQSKKEEV